MTPTISAKSCSKTSTCRCGTGLNKIKGKAFRIGHIGHFNDLMLMGTLSGVEMGLDLAKVPHRSGGVLAAMEVLKGRDVVPMPKSKAAVA